MRARVFLISPVIVIALAAACGHRAPTPVRVGAPPNDGGGAVVASHGSGRCTPWSESGEGKQAEPSSTPPPDDSDQSFANRNRHTEPLKKGDLCETADSNLARAEAKILADAVGGPPAAHVAWDHKTKPERFDLVARRLSLSKVERDLLTKNGFVVQSRNTSSTYAWGLHEVYQSQLPIYISADAILHAVYTSNDHLLADIERDILEPLLARTLSAMHCALANAARSYPVEVANDLDLYLTVARTLLADAPVASVFGSDAAAAKLVAAARGASGMENLEIFGRGRLVDWSQYQPRGHYADKKAAAAAAAAAGDADDSSSSSSPPDDGKSSLAPYFRAGMWLSRLEFNLVSRSSRSSLLGVRDPRETPREAVVAIALSDLAERGQVVDDVARLDRAWALLAGQREDVSISDMIALRKKGAITSIEIASFDKLKAAIGNGFQRTARLHPMPEGSTVLPAIATFLGPRVVADAAAFRPLVHSEVSERYLVGSGDVAYILGLDRGKAYLKEDLAAHPELAQKLDEARGIIAKANGPAAVAASGDLYGAWLSALRGVAAKPTGIGVPSFMQTTAYDDLRMNTLVAGYGQIRHNYVLMAGQSYDEGGCVIPDGWVEPMPAMYEGISTYASRGVVAMKELAATSPRWSTAKKSQPVLKDISAYFDDLGHISRVLAQISRHELEGRALTTEEKRFLSMVVEMTPGSTGSSPTYTGWYFDLFRDRVEEGLASADFVADYHTSSWKEKVVYAGAMSPRMGVFVIDAGGPPRLAVGPVAHAYEVQSSLEKRLDDQSVAKATGKTEPWSASYTAPAPTEPAIAAATLFKEDGKQTRTILRGGRVALSNVVIEILDHHRVPVATTTRNVPANGKVVVNLTPARPAEGIRLRIGEYAVERFFGGAESAASIEMGGMSVGANDFSP